MYTGISRMTLPGYALYCPHPACAKEILGFFRAEGGSSGSQRAIRMQFRPSEVQFAGTEARSAQTARHRRAGQQRREPTNPFQDRPEQRSWNSDLRHLEHHVPGVPDDACPPE